MKRKISVAFHENDAKGETLIYFTLRNSTMDLAYIKKTGPSFI